MTLTRRIWHIANTALLLLLLLFGRLGYWQLVRGRELQPVVVDPVQAAEQYAGDLGPDTPITLEVLPQPVVQRTVAALSSITRGVIYDRNGAPLAYNVTTGDGGRVRVYAEPSLAHVVGYVSGLGTGVVGIEYSYNLSLLGLDRFDSQLAELVHRPIVGSDVYLTIDARIQRAAAEALGNQPGGVVVLDPYTGAVLAMVSAPGFDPNRILDPGYAASLAQDCGGLPGCGVFLNRAAQGVFTPGSTWKTVTLIAALDTGLVTRETVFDFGEPVQGPNGPYYTYEVGGGVIVDPNHRENRLNLDQSYAASANAAFGRMGYELGPEAFIDYAARLGFSTERGAPPLEIDATPAQVANDPASLHTNPFLRASTAIGQGELLASPLSMALVVAGVLNEGDVPRAHLVQSVRHPSGRQLEGEPRGAWLNNAMKPSTAQQVREMMIYNVSTGSGGAAGRPGLTVGGKTGTAQLGGDLPPHAWFIGFAEAGDQAIAMAVVVENGGSGNQVAAPIFGQIAEAALRYLNEPAAAVGNP